MVNGGLTPLGPLTSPAAKIFADTFRLPYRHAKGASLSTRPLVIGLGLGLSDGMFRLIGPVGDGAVASPVLIGRGHFDFEALARPCCLSALLSDLERGGGHKAHEHPEVNNCVGGGVGLAGHLLSPSFR